MTVEDTPIDNVIQFPAEKLPKFGFERVTRRKSGDAAMEQAGQLNLFTGGVGDRRPRQTGDVVPIAAALGPFDEALMYDEQGDDRAADAYHKAIQQEDSVADAYCNLGFISTRNGRTSQAFDYFTEALKSDPQHFESHYNVANLYFEGGELRPARLHYQVAAELDPEFANVYFNLAIVDAMSGALDSALTALTRYKELVPADDSGKADELLATLKRTLEQN